MKQSLDADKLKEDFLEMVKNAKEFCAQKC